MKKIISVFLLVFVLVLLAGCKKKVELVLNYNGFMSKEVEVREIDYNKDYVVDYPKNPGFNYDGWYVLGGKKRLENNTIKIKKRTEIVLRWTEKYLNVNFDTLSEELEEEIVKEQTFKYGDIIKLRPVGKNHFFAGWYVSKEFKKEDYFGKANPVETNMTLYAKWVDYEELFELEELTDSVKVNGLSKFGHDQEKIIVPRSLKGKTNITFKEEAFTKAEGSFARNFDLSRMEVKSLVPGLFQKSDATEIILPKGLEEINDFLFSGAYNLNSIVLPESLKIIGEKSFFGCVGLLEIIVPKGVETVKKDAFLDCLHKEIKLRIRIKGHIAKPSGWDDSFNPSGCLEIYEA